MADAPVLYPVKERLLNPSESRSKTSQWARDFPLLKETHVFVSNVAFLEKSKYRVGVAGWGRSSEAVPPRVPPDGWRAVRVGRFGFGLL